MQVGGGNGDPVITIQWNFYAIIDEINLTIGFLISQKLIKNVGAMVPGGNISNFFCEMLQNHKMLGIRDEIRQG
jgi:hypothetical protein